MEISNPIVLKGKRLSIPLLITIVIATISALHHFQKPNLITYDVYGYYSYLPAAISFGDLKKFEFVNDHFDNYPMGSGNYQVTSVGENRIPIYTMGLAVAVSPFYIIAEVISALMGWPRDGLASCYQFFFWLSSIFYCFLGFLFLERFLKPRFDRKVVVIVLIAIAFGTNYFLYSAFENGLTHAYIFSLYAILLWLCDQWIIERRQVRTISIGVIIALLCLIRPTEVIAVCLPIGFVFMKEGFKGFMDRWKEWILITIIGFLMILPQITLWKLNTGQWLFNAYMEQGHAFHLTKPHLLDGLFSYRKGWLLYTPLMILALVGFLSQKMRKSKWFIPVLIYVILHIWITFSWSMWWYASSLGSRPMIHAYAALSLPLAFLINSVKIKPLIYGLIAGCLVLNLLQTYQLNKKIIPWDGINKIYYWKTFGHLKRDASLIKYVDLNTALPGLKKYKPGLISKLNWAQFQVEDSSITTIMIENKMSERVTPQRQFSYPLVHTIDGRLFEDDGQKWLLISSDLYRKGDLFDAYQIAQLGVSFHHQNEKIYEDGIRFPFHLEENEWGVAEFEVPIPIEMEVGDEIRVFVWNPSPDTIFVHELKIDLLQRN